MSTCAHALECHVQTPLVLARRSRSHHGGGVSLCRPPAGAVRWHANALRPESPADPRVLYKCVLRTGNDVLHSCVVRFRICVHNSDICLSVRNLIKHPPWGSNPRPQGQEPCALPTELGGLDCSLRVHTIYEIAILACSSNVVAFGTSDTQQCGKGFLG